MPHNTATDKGGIPARYATYCARCGEFIDRGEPIVHQRGAYIHATCASGQEDQ